MSDLLITEIECLTGLHREGLRRLQGLEMSELPNLKDAWLFINNGLIQDFGRMTELSDELKKHPNQISAKGQYVLPSWCDSHTHLVFAQSREEEFVMKIKGKSYEEIAEAGGGILNSASKLAAMPEDELYKFSYARLAEIIRTGTGAVEIKSGYGLSVDGELKMLRVIKRLKENSPIPIKATFLAAHAYPLEYRNNHKAYLDLIIEKMLPVIAKEKLADYIDVFCEKGFFSNEECGLILKAGALYGLKPKIHANQLTASGAVETGVEYSALTVDHLEEMNDSAISALQNSTTIATLLPGCSLFLGIPFAKARELVSANIALAIASDFNPGSTPSGNMNLVVALACIKLKLLPEEAINAATINGAAAMELSEMYGSITKGKVANLIITQPIPSIAYLPYSFGSNLIDKIILKGVVHQ